MSQDLNIDPAGKHVVILEDLIDTVSSQPASHPDSESDR
jgi:hypoxanthine-guanine phosphoribosyltransferase